MTTTYQTNVLDTTFNGWTNYETWNVALWINNDESLYHLACDTARDGGNYAEFCEVMSRCYDSLETPDGVQWAGPSVNTIAMNEMMYELVDG